MFIFSKAKQTKPDSICIAALGIREHKEKEESGPFVTCKIKGRIDTHTHTHKHLARRRQVCWREKGL